MFFLLQKSGLESDIENLNSRLDEEKTHTENLQGQMTTAKSKLQEDMFRTRSALLADIISMQLFYTIKDLSIEDGLNLSENELSLKDFCSQWAATKAKILEDTDLLLELLRSYLNVMNSKGEKLLENCGSLKSLIGSDELLDERTLLCDSEDASLYMTNKTDDDKVVASSRSETLPALESHNENFTPSNEKKLRDSEEHASLRDKLVSLKNCIDDEALGFLKKTFELDDDNENKLTDLDTRQSIYAMIREFMEQRNTFLG